MEEEENPLETQNNDVKSTAVVKYSSVDQLANYQRLQHNFDLKEPPANWLHAGSKWENYICNASLRKQQGQFSSFNMAHCFPEVTGDIDVVTDAENIKKLLKMPFGGKGHVSMMVHRVGNSLLLDDFDIHKHLLKKQQNDWQWLRKFYYDTVAHNMQHKNKCVMKKNKSRHFLQDRNMFSKFLYYSSCEGSDDLEEENGSGGVRDLGSHGSCSSFTTDMTQRAPPHPHTQPCHSTAGAVLPDPVQQNEQPEFQRTVSWTFEDIRMLIGTDLPIFGGGTHPCVSLKLRDMQKPINVLTGLDYWLDNLMCNVPELAMCYHVDGIVQKYELLKTEDIPEMNGSKFSPQVVKDIAQNILSFLKSNATREGHTYWLFKGSDDEVVKLYDLSTLCADYLDDQNFNPFSVPVGILLYRVARNMRKAEGRKKSSIIRTLLEHCLQLLDKEVHSQVITSAHYLLSDLYINEDHTQQTGKNLTSLVSNQDGNGKQRGKSGQKSKKQHTVSLSGDSSPSRSSLTSEARQFCQSSSEEDKVKDMIADENCDEDESEEVSDDEQNSATKTVDIKALCISESVKVPKNKQLIRYPPISNDSSERYGQAVKHIAEGLRCLDVNATVQNSKNCKHQVDEQERCNPAEAIPLRDKPQLKIQIKNKPTNRSEEHPPSYQSVTQTMHKRDKFSRNSSSPEVDFCEISSSTETDGDKAVNQEVSIWTGSLPANSWHVESKVLLLLKATLVYSGLAEISLAKQQYGEVVRCLKIGLLCFSAMKGLSHTKAKDNVQMLKLMLSLAGDALLMLSHCGNDTLLADHHKSFETMSDSDLFIQESAEKECKENEYTWLQYFILDSQEMLENSVKCYKSALEQVEKVEQNDKLNNIKKRLANALNELGVCYMNKGAALTDDYTSEQSPNARELWDKSLSCMKEGIVAFESIGDKVNMSLLHSNIGRLMRMVASASFNSQENVLDTGQAMKEFTQKEKQLFFKAVESYQTALELLEKRDKEPGIWDSVTWELSTVYFTMGTLYQDYAPLSCMAEEQVEREVTELMNKSLKFCDTDTECARLPTCQYRAATVHHRLASMYHKAYRSQLTDQKKKHLRQLAELHYGKAYTFFTSLESAFELLRVLLEQVAMYEFQLNSQTNTLARLRTLQSGLSYLLESGPCLVFLHAHLKMLEDDLSRDLREYHEEAGNLLSIFQSRLNFILMNLVKCHSQLKKGKAAEDTQAEKQNNKLLIYKTMYGIVLKYSQQHGSDKKNSDVLTNCQLLKRLVDKLNLELVS